MASQSTVFVTTAINALDDTDRSWRGPLKGEFGRVLQEQNRALARRKPLACCREMATQDIGLINPGVSEKSIGSFGVRPILARKRNAGAHAITKLAEQFTKAMTKPSIRKSGWINLLAGPMIVEGIGRSGLATNGSEKPLRTCSSSRGAQQRITRDSFDSRKIR